MKKTAKRRSKYFAPQKDENCVHPCDHPGCSEPGEYRAPKDRDLKDYYWFCLKHVQEYNARWNYYDGIDPEAETAGRAGSRRFSFKSKVKYNFGFDFNGNFEFFDNYDPEAADIKTPYLNAADRENLKIMELKAEELSPESLKKQYKKLVKKYHPDLNQGDREAEEKFKRLAQAYQSLCARFS